MALLGPNGAGKTTLLRILASLTKPTSGAVQVDGFRLPQQASAARARIGFVGHQPLLYEDLSAEQNLAFYARLFRIKSSRTRIDKLLAEFGLASRGREPVRNFSRGMQQRLALARALLHRPRVLLLDEPHSGLDRAAVSIIDAAIRRLAKRGATILIATHDLPRAQRLAQRVEIMSGGRIIDMFTRRELLSPKFPAHYDRLLRVEQ